MRRALLILLCMLPVRAQQVSQTYQAGGVTFTPRVLPKNPVAGDEVRVELKVTAPGNVAIELPDNLGMIDCAGVLDRESPSSHAETFVLDPIGPGTCHIPALTVRYGDSTIESQAIVFPIASMIPPGETSPDIRDGQTPLTVPEEEVNWPAIVAAALVVMAAIAWFTFSGRKPVERRAAPEPAEARARRRLDQLGQPPVPVPREFYSELSRVLTAYLDDRLGLRSTRCTSPEVLAAVHRTGYMTATARDLLGALLDDCDCAKFSAVCALGDNPDEAIACCRQIIDILGAQAASRPRLLQEERELTRA